MSRLRVGIFTSAHPLDDVRVYTKMARSFLETGFAVSWVGPDETYFDEGFRDPAIEYHLAPPARTRRERLLSARRVASAAKALPAMDWWYSPDPDAARLLPRLPLKPGGGTIFDVHEVFHGALLDRWTGGREVPLLRRAVRSRLRSTCRRMDVVIAVSDSVLAHYAPPSGRAFAVRNCAPTWFADRIEPALLSGDRPRVMHGKLIPSNGTPLVLAALRRVARRGLEVTVVASEPPGAAGSAQFDALASTGADLVDAGVLVLRPGVPHRHMPAELQSCSIGLIAYGRELGIDSMPNRLFEYMASGLAVIVPEYAVEMSRIVRDERIGILADFESVESVAEALTWMVEHPEERQEMGRRARDAFLREHNWEMQIARLTSLMLERSRG